MKVFISADMEGTAGICDWNETIRSHPDWQEFRSLMTAEVVAACEGALAAGATEVTVKDAHDSGRNLIVGQLPDYVRVVRGWSGHPDSMMFGLSRDFAAAIYTGYHSKAGDEGNPLAHTSNRHISRLLLNGQVASEFTINALCAAGYGVPSVFMSGDAGICADARAMLPGMVTVETLTGTGPATNSISPVHACRLIRAGVEAALRQDMRALIPPLTGPFEVVVEFTNPNHAEKASWYPGARKHGPRSIAYQAAEFADILRALLFIKG